MPVEREGEDEGGEEAKGFRAWYMRICTACGCAGHSHTLAHRGEHQRASGVSSVESSVHEVCVLARGIRHHE